MNKGVAFAKGDVIAFLNADDMYAGTWVLSEVVEHFTSLGLDAVFGNLSYFHPNKIHQVRRVYRSPNNVCETLSWGLMPAHPTLFLSKEIFVRYGVFDSNYKIAGDFDFIARAFRSNTLRYKNLNKVMVNMQLGGVSTAGIKNTILLNNEIYRSCCKYLIRTNYFKLYARYPRKLLELIHLTR
jgi:glycosyltransferase involved in cell wall biosynthesis